MILKFAGEARIMIYHKWSFLGFILYFRYAILGFKPWLSLSDVFSNIWCRAQAFQKKRLMNYLKTIVLLKYNLASHADLLSSYAGQRHTGILINIARSFAKKIY